ncbi:hypothetical protein VTL71DRAFT_4754 [Oculimacula yallundae]|uniref:2EXR domain-containing protein n=1 Tax=Oculimacula yallundae TaxID=86028 RepID=A0ABR4C2V3_9HELO
MVSDTNLFLVQSRLERLFERSKQIYYNSTISILFIASVKARFDISSPPLLEWTGPGERLVTFHPFPRLPVELRQIIWTFALPSERVITFCTREKSFVDGIAKIWPPGNTARLREFGLGRWEGHNYAGSYTKSRNTQLAAGETSDPGDSTDCIDSDAYTGTTDDSDDSEDSKYIDNPDGGPSPVTTGRYPVNVMGLHTQTLSLYNAQLNSHSGGGQAVSQRQTKDTKDIRDIGLNKQTVAGVTPDRPSITPTTQIPPPKLVKAKYYPTLLQVNKDSRTVALKNFQLVLHKERDGKPIYIDFRCEEIRLLDRKSLQVLCGLQSWKDRNERLLGDVLGQNRNELEKKLRFLRLEDRWIRHDLEEPMVPLLARFRNLSEVSLYVDSFSQNGYGYDARAREAEVKDLWVKDDQERGEGYVPNKIAEFRYSNVRVQPLR